VDAVAKCLELRVATAAPALPARRLLVVAVRDYDEEAVAREELEAAIAGMLHTAYGELEQLPAAYAATELQDLFDVQFSFLASETLCAPQFESAAAAFGRLIGDAARNGYADAGMTPAGVDASATRIWEALDPASAAASGAGGKELPAERELAATFACDEIMRGALGRYTSTTRQWKATVESGRIIRDFGKESSSLISSTLDKYAADAANYRTTRAFSRKKDELRALCLADAYTLYAKQILKLREVAYQVFRGNLARIRINDRVEKNVNAVVKSAENYFVEKAESLRSTLSNWRFDNERHELVNHMREDATERLQLARLQGNYVPPIRAPVAVAFHTLLTAPFGQDAAAAQAAAAGAEQMQHKVDKDKVKKAELSRARPHQRSGYTFTVGRKDQVKPEDVMKTFAGIFTSSSDASKE
jgi:Root hair defective 3 GTP-binding protein (RHD3)